jgi:serine/threonine-protein kinase RsbW
MAFAETLVRLQLSSSLELLELVGIVTDSACRLARLDDEARHWVTMAVRESVINAVVHGNENDARKLVFVEFASSQPPAPPELHIRVRDEGGGFDPAEVADPLTPENILKSGGRGVFLIRSFMDEVVLQRAPEGGMEIRMVKRLQDEASR